MPLAISKDDTFKLFLDTDKDIPESERPTFIFRYLTGREQRKLGEKIDDFKPSFKNVETIDYLFKILKEYLVGWENLPFDKDKVEDILRWQEAQELVYSTFSYSPQLEILKNLGLQLPTPTEPSVNQEVAESAKTQ